MPSHLDLFYYLSIDEASANNLRTWKDEPSGQYRQQLSEHLPDAVSLIFTRLLFRIVRAERNEAQKEKKLFCKEKKYKFHPFIIRG